MGTDKNRRRIKNILLQPGIQFRLFFPFILTILVFDITIYSTTVWLIRELNNFFPDMNMQQLEALQSMHHRAVWAGIFGMLLPAVVAFGFTALQFHRVLGPLVAIQRHVRTLIEGDYSKTLTLRQADELKSLADDLNELTVRLRATKPS